MNRILKWTFRTFALLIIIVGIIFLFNYTFIIRGLTYPAETAITSSEWYVPKAHIQGSNSTNYTLTDSLSIEESILEDISAYAEERNSSALLVLHKGKLQLERYWQGSSRASTTNSMSMAKSVISLLIGIAIEEGKIGNEKDLASLYLKEWQNDERNKITIEDLLLMQSGLRKDDDSEDLFSDIVELYAGTDLVNTAIHIPLVKEPGKKFEYNNVNTVILGIILERATGEQIESYLSSRL